MPVGFKNGTYGTVQIAIDAIAAAAGEHHFLSVTKQGISAIVGTRGNDRCHVILRGSRTETNYDRGSVETCAAMLEAAGLPPRIMIDCSHGNSRRDYRRQPEVARNVATQVAEGSPHVFGIMLESHLEAGSQKLGSGPLVYGQSITDACMDWKTTDGLLEELAEAVRARRRRGA